MTLVTDKTNQNTKAPTTFGFTNPKNGVPSAICDRCRRRYPTNINMCRRDCLYMFSNSMKKTTPIQQGYSTNMISTTQDNTDVANSAKEPQATTTMLDAATQTNLLSRLLEYKEREFWFISFAGGLIIVLLVIIILVLVSQRRKKHKIVDPRIY